MSPTKGATTTSPSARSYRSRIDGREGVHREDDRRYLCGNGAARHCGGKQLPAFHTHYDGLPAPLMTICVDQTEFVVNKLRDRGTHQAYGVVTNAQDFMHILRHFTRLCLPRPLQD